MAFQYYNLRMTKKFFIGANFIHLVHIEVELLFDIIY